MTEKQKKTDVQKRRKKIAAVMAAIIAIIFLVWTVLGSIMAAVYASADNASQNVTADEEMRGIWVSTVYRLDYPAAATTDAAALMAQADQILDNSKAMGMNAVFLQVRPSADALYSSAYFPWSRYLSGTAGVAPDGGFDPLTYWVQAAHERGMELHAWINPYRVTRSGASEYEALPASSPAKQHPDWVVEYSGNYYFNPALPEVRQLVVDGALEIVKNYAVDGIHLDDYFYPGTDFNDAAAYAAYGTGFGDIGDFRRDNVNKLIQQLDTELHAANPDLSFGVSPSGIWANSSTRPEGSATQGAESYSMYYADTLYWAQQGLVDYLAPQIYWNIGYSVADYSILVEWWSNALKNTDVKLYIGMADYRSAEATSASSVWYGTAELRRQLDLNRQTAGISGEIHFRYRMMQENEEIPSFLQSYYEGAFNPAQPSESDPSGGSQANPGDQETGSGFPFRDVTQDNWYYDAVSYVSEHELMIGTSRSAFAPEDPLERGMLVTILYRLAGSPQADTSSISAPDVEKDTWYSAPVAWATENGIVEGYDNGYFGPSDDITREQMAVIFCRYAADRGLDVKEAGKNVNLDATSSVFQDGSLTSSYAVDSMKWALGSGLLNGKGDGSLDPTGTATRAETAQILMNFCEKILS